MSALSPEFFGFDEDKYATYISLLSDNALKQERYDQYVAYLDADANHTSTLVIHNTSN